MYMYIRKHFSIKKNRSPFCVKQKFVIQAEINADDLKCQFPAQKSTMVVQKDTIQAYDTDVHVLYMYHAYNVQCAALISIGSGIHTFLCMFVTSTLMFILNTGTINMIHWEAQVIFWNSTPHPSLWFSA